jgi:putative ABC transport system ATP-binding protein
MPTQGTYRIHGIPMTGLDEAILGAIRGQLFGFIFQSFHLLPGRSAAENVEMGMLYGPQRRQERRRRAAAVLDRVGLKNRAHADPRRLSGGERQRVAIARAVAAGPRVLFCDEPTGNLDSVAGENLLSLLRELHLDGLTLVVVTHDEAVAAEGSRRLRVVDGVVQES